MPYKRVVMLPVPPGYSPEEFLKCVRDVVSPPWKAGLVDIEVLENKVSISDELIAHIGMPDTWQHVREETANRLAKFLEGSRCISWTVCAKPEYRSQEYTNRLVIVADPSQLKQV